MIFAHACIIIIKDLCINIFSKKKNKVPDIVKIIDLYDFCCT